MKKVFLFVPLWGIIGSTAPNALAAEAGEIVFQEDRISMLADSMGISMAALWQGELVLWGTGMIMLTSFLTIILRKNMILQK